MSLGCKVCDDKAAALTIDRYLDQGLTYTLIARSLTLAAWPVTDSTISSHDKHRVKGVNPEIKASKRDAAIIIKNRVLDAIESRPDRDGQWIGEGTDRVWLPASDILDKDLQPALGTALKAQAIEDRREQKKAPALTFILQLASALGERLELSDGLTIDGEATEID